MRLQINRTKWIPFLALALVGFITLFLMGCKETKSSAPAEGVKESKTLYTCGMHPQVVQDKPGNCPICGMKLTPIRSQDAANDSQAIAIDPVTTQNMGIRTALITRGPLRRTIRTVGSIDYDETALQDVTTKFKGWIEKLNVNSTGQQVHRGDPLFEIYSPDLYSAQREYLLALDAGKKTDGRSSLEASALNKLKFYDISDEQIAELKNTGNPTKTLRILAPMDAFVLDKMVVQGQMVDPGMKLFRLADLGLVWVQAQVYEQDLAYIKLGQEATVTLSYLPDREFRGRVTYVYPNVDEKTRTARVRLELHNPGYFLKPGMFATVQISSELDPSVLLVPEMAVLRSGEKNTAFVALDGGKFEPRNLVLGPAAENGMYQVVSGLKEGERIVTSGQFMLDSESQLREAIQKMREPKASSTPEKTTAGPGALADGKESKTAMAADSKTLKYICPMPEHVSILYDRPGVCSICSMTLVPVNSAELRKVQPGGKLLYYTCPMPEHSDLHLEKPGKCPQCGMTLIPIMSAPSSSDKSTNAASATQSLPALYTCPMASDADVVSDKPGKCPKCDMDLVLTTTVDHGKQAEEKWRQQHSAQPAPAAHAH